MAEDMADKLKSLLNNPEMMGMLSSFLSTQKEDEAPQSPQPSADIQSMISRIQSSDDKRITLLNALRPYMRSSRASGIDKAVKMLKITQLGSILKDL